MTRLAAIAVERGWERIDFQVLDWNPARDFSAGSASNISTRGCATAAMRLRSADLPSRICPTEIDPADSARCSALARANIWRVENSYRYRLRIWSR